jgi:hypothetical protein
VIHTAQRYRQESSGGLLYDRSQASAAEFLKKVKLQFADFYRVSKKLGLHEFKELMNAKASASDVDGKTLKDHSAASSFFSSKSVIGRRRGVWMTGGQDRLSNSRSSKTI